ncbi:hypothetical protein ACFVWY_24145 [Streptomyces sp. NPDC058195]|uniref:hypothetical protein n=1 Tax=Streptomyces sp. NPDC058195 TaxID=3346375 RepID=UPI0036EECF43
MEPRPVRADALFREAGDDDPATLPDAAHDDEAGRGPRVVGGLARARRTSGTERGKTVWSEQVIDAVPRPRPSTR